MNLLLRTKSVDSSLTAVSQSQENVNQIGMRRAEEILLLSLFGELTQLYPNNPLSLFCVFLSLFLFFKVQPLTSFPGDRDPEFFQTATPPGSLLLSSTINFLFQFSFFPLVPNRYRMSPLKKTWGTNPNLQNRQNRAGH